MKNVSAFDELARLFVTGLTVPVTKPSHFYRQFCRRDVSALTHGSFGILRHYQETRHFAMDQRLRLETLGWIVINFSENPLPDDEVERQRARIIHTPLVRRDREYPFCEGLVTDVGAVVGPQPSILAKVSSVLEVLRLGGSFELVEQLWALFSQTVICVSIEICWSRNEVLVNIRSVSFP